MKEFHMNMAPEKPPFWVIAFISFWTFLTVLHFVRFQVLMAVSMKFRVFWDVAPCSHFEVD
jgi:hypothetical protein